MNFIQTVLEFKNNYPTNDRQSVLDALKFGSANLKKFVTVVIYGKNCNPRSFDPFPQEFENPFYYTARMDNEECLKILIATGRENFDSYFDKFLDGIALTDFDISNYDNSYWLMLMNQIMLSNNNARYAI